MSEEVKERIYKLLDGFELIVSEEALFVRVAPGRMPITTSEEVEFDRVLALVDHLQQQLAEKDEAINELHEKANHYAAVRDNAVDHGYKQALEIGKLRQVLEDIKPYIQSLQVDILNESKSYLLNVANLLLQKIDTALERGKNNG